MATSTFRIPVVRSFKAFDDGAHKKYVLTVLARNLPLDLPLEANARLPNVIRNKTCREMRKTLLTKPENFQLLNGGIICAASSIEVKQDGTEHVVEVTFDDQGGVINGGHTYGQLAHLLFNETVYSHDKDVLSVLELDAAEDQAIAGLVSDKGRLEAALSRARDKAQVQVEIISPVNDQDLLVEISTARNRSMPVDETGFQNLAGRFDLMKQVLRQADDPFGPVFEQRVVWKPNQEVPEDSKAIPVKALVQLMALMNIERYPADRPANEVYIRAGVVIREFGDPGDEEGRVYEGLMLLLPKLIRLYEHIYSSLPDATQTFSWADGKEEADKSPAKRSAKTPFLQLPCTTKVAVPLIWPVFAAFRCLLEWSADGVLSFKSDPIALFDDMKSQLATPMISFVKRVRLLSNVGRDKEIWVRLDGLVANELVTRDRLATLRDNKGGASTAPKMQSLAADEKGSASVVKRDASSTRSLPPTPREAQDLDLPGGNRNDYKPGETTVLHAALTAIFDGGPDGARWEAVQAAVAAVDTTKPHPLLPLLKWANKTHGYGFASDAGMLRCTNS